MVDATEAHAHDQDDGQLKEPAQIGHVQLVPQGNPPAANTLDEQQFGPFRQLLPRNFNHPRFDGRTFHLRGDVGCDRRFKAVGVDQVIGCLATAQFLDCQCIGIVQTVGRGDAARSNRFHSRHRDALVMRQPHQATGNQGLAAVGIGAGDEIFQESISWCLIT